MQQPKKEAETKTPPVDKSLNQTTLPQYGFQKHEYGSGSTSGNLSDQNQKAEC